MRKTALFLAASSVALFLGAPARSALIELLPSSTSVQVGQSFGVDVHISGLGASGASVAMLTVAIQVPAFLRFEGASFTTAMDPGPAGLSSMATFDPRHAGVFVWAMAEDPGAVVDLLQPDSFTLATLTFAAEAAGEAAVQGLAMHFGNTSGQNMWASVNGFNITAEDPPLPPDPLPGGGGGAEHMPEPTAGLLFPLGFALSALAVRRRAAR